jgi:hypothetical protein
MRSLFERPIQSGLFCETNPLGMTHEHLVPEHKMVRAVIDALCARASILEWCPSWFGPCSCSDRPAHFISLTKVRLAPEIPKSPALL